MKIPVISLKLLVALAFLALGLVLVAGYSLLSANYFVRGMDSIIAAYLEDVAEHYVATVPPEFRRSHVSILSNDVVPDWSMMPENIRHEFGNPRDIKANVLVQSHDANRLDTPKNLYFLLHYQRDGNDVYVARYVTRESASPIVAASKRKSNTLLMGVSLGSVIALGAVIWLLNRQISRPMARLGRWTRRLTPDTLAAPVPDFSYPELNQLADLIRSSLSSVQESLEREQKFLRHASHELRTPISIVRSNVLLMRKLQKHLAAEPGYVPDSRKAQVVDRIDRASLTMKHLTETLLWLSRDETDSLARQHVRLDQIVAQQCEDMQYLLVDKPVTLDLRVSPYEVDLQEVPVKIVIGNLIRNACQHCWEGDIQIRQTGSVVEISNQIPDAEDREKSDPGFGLGLQLTERLTEKLGWDYEYHIEGNVYRALVNFKP